MNLSVLSYFTWPRYFTYGITVFCIAATSETVKAQILSSNWDSPTQLPFYFLKNPNQYYKSLEIDLNRNWPLSHYDSRQCSQALSLLDSSKNANKFAFFQEECASNTFKTKLFAQVNFGLNYQSHSSTLGDSIDNGGNTSGNNLVISPFMEPLDNWNHSPSFIRLGLYHRLFSGFHLYLELSLKTTLDAWFEKDFNFTGPYQVSQVDINEPKIGYANWSPNPHFNLILGRFPLHWGASPNLGLSLSHSAPYHDGALIKLSNKYFNFFSFAGSLNPWLSGTPSKFADSIPPSSEAYIQAHPDYGDLPNNDYNSRNLIYNQPIKTLFAHRAEAIISNLKLGVSEINIIGGKVPDFRDFNPFGIYHNNFGDGYSSIAVSLDAHYQLHPKISFFGELIMDEIQEQKNGGNPTTLGWMLGGQHNLSFWHFSLLQSLELVQTDPLLYNQKRPLLRLYNRQVIKSNFIEVGDKPFTDTYIADYPLGYARGADVLDLWYRIFIKYKERNFVSLKYGWLNTGEWNSLKIYKETSQSSPSGKVNKAHRLHINNNYFITKNWLIWANIRFQFEYEKGWKEKVDDYQIYNIGFSYFY